LYSQEHFLRIVQNRVDDDDDDDDDAHMEKHPKSTFLLISPGAAPDYV